MRLSVLVAAVSLCLIGLAVADDVRASIRKPTNIPAQALGSALEVLAKDRNLQVVYVSEELSGLRTHGAVGEFSSEEALRELLAGTGMTFRYLDENTVTIVQVSSMSSATGDAPAPADATSKAPTPDDSHQEGKKSSSEQFRVAQVDQGQTSGPATVEQSGEQTSMKKPTPLEEIVVTGSRIPTPAGQGAQEVKIYTREQIDQSGQTTIGDFMNTLPDVSVAVGESGYQTSYGATTVQLHGLPLGTTLTLINGQRVETVGAQAGNGDFFDLNNIPLAAVDRIEVVSEGSSAIYGSDAIAGVVNIILKQAFNGFEADVKRGWASDSDEWDASLAWGKVGKSGSISAIVSYQTRGELTTSERSLTSSNDYTAFGGANGNLPTCSPGNVFSVDGSPLPGAPAGSNASFAAVSSSVHSGKPPFSAFSYGTLNECAYGLDSSLIPETHRMSILVEGNLELPASMELFSDVMYSHVQQYLEFGPPNLFGENSFQQFTASASNPFNPFGEAVGVTDVLTGAGQTSFPLYTDFVRTVVGMRGNVFSSWHWELSAWDSMDESRNTETTLNNAATQNALNSPNPATALNPFVAGPAGSPALLSSLLFDQSSLFRGQTLGANGILRGTALTLPSGPLQVAIGGEYDRDKLYSDYIDTTFEPPNTQATYHRRIASAFAEARIPIVGDAATPNTGQTLAATVAGRIDDYNDFGSQTTPQFGIEWRPLGSLLVRGTYGRSFRAPPLFDLYFAGSTVPGETVVDPARGNQPEVVTVTTGGNPALRPETGESTTLGFVYSSQAVPGLQLSVTYWDIVERGNIQELNDQTVVENENLFPGSVIRAGSCAGGLPCPIIQVNDRFLNFGEIRVAGFDCQIRYSYKGAIGTFTPSLTATQTYKYDTEITPGAPTIDAASNAQDTGDWAPHWKGTAAINWSLGAVSANVDGRFVGQYQDYDSTNRVGNFWLYDASVKFMIGHALASGSQWAEGVYITLGGVNLFNTLPQFSNYGFGFLGYDPAQADIRGRFLYAQLGTKW